jgi:hypothetical protein
MVLLRAIALRRLHQPRRGFLSDFYYGNISLTTIICHFKINLSDCVDNGCSKIGDIVPKYIWKD